MGEKTSSIEDIVIGLAKLHISDYDARLLASDIKAYFEVNSEAIEVLIFKGKKQVAVDRDFVRSPQYHRLFRKRYEK